MNLKKVIPTTAALAALVVLASAGAAAANPLVDVCATVPADATLWLGEGTPKVEASSGDLNYTGYWRPCDKFVVDVQVPSNSSGGAGFLPAFTIETPTPTPTPGYCYDFVQKTSVYRGLKHLGHVTFYAAERYDGTCRVIPISNESDPWPSSFTPPKTRVTTYRVVTTADYPDLWCDCALPVLVRAAHLPAL
jgi:hypothetical protein